MVATKQDVRGQIAALLGEVKREIDVSRRSRIYCNRHIKMERIELVGFDMDYTLALYQQERLERLSIEKTLEKMCKKHNYPREILDLRYDPEWGIRGLVVDKPYGNVLKMDRHAVVGRVYHGRTLLSKEARDELYRTSKIRLSSDRYAWIDTLFALPEAVMFINLVDYFDKQPGPKPEYEKLFEHIREAIDEAHADNSLKSVITANIPEFIMKDPRLAEALHKLRSSGKKLFLLTNSDWDYSSKIMSYLLDGARQAYPTWRNYFDVVIVSGCKPAFFTERRPFLALDPNTGHPVSYTVKGLSRDLIYQGGNIFDFEEMIRVRGDRTLYVGDHIYGDILKLRKTHTWRTAMVIQELDGEYSTSERVEQELGDLDILDRRRRNLESEIDYQVLMLKQIQRLLEEATDPELRPELDNARRQAREALDALRGRNRIYEEEVDALEASIDRSYNPYWGAIFREAHENSRFGQQVSDYADLYTSRTSNFVSYSPLRYFRAPRKRMPHEL